MEQAEVCKETLDCPVCLDLLKDPVTVPCGHSFCMRCLQRHWDNHTVFSCPQCRTTFKPRPDLKKNTVLAALVEELKNHGLQRAPADHCYAGAEDVACDSCCGRKLKALKSCLVCLASFCHKHLQPHYDAAAFKRHKLVDPSHQLQENICSRHGEVMKMFCRTDQQCICSLCWVDDHKGHDTVSVAAERQRANRQKELEVSRQEVQRRIQDGEKNAKVLEKEVMTINVSANKAVEHSEKTFTDLICVLEKRCHDVTQQIRSQQEVEVSRVKELQQKLEQEIAELRRTDGELQQLSHTDNHPLCRYSSLPRLSRSTYTSGTVIPPLSYFTHLMDAVSDARDKLLDVLRDTWTNISQAPVSEPRTRAELLQFSREVTLDPNTVNKHLLLSEGNRRVMDMDEEQSYPRHPDRFTVYGQVLSSQSLTGHCYWEVELSGDVDVAVAYKTIGREGGGNECGFGRNDQSWSLDCHSSGCTFWHNNVSCDISGVRPSRVGVFLDHRGGVLSFYSVCGTTRLLHRVHTTFTQPLYAGIRFWDFGSSAAELLKLNE